MNKEQIETTDWLTRGIPKEQLEREKQEAIMSADLQGCITYNKWSVRKRGINSIDFDATSEKMVAKGYRKREWISVDERLPDKGGKYLVYRELCNGLSLMNIINYDPNYDGHAMWFLFDGEWGDCEVNNVTHWMPLPEPPKMKGYENG